MAKLTLKQYVDINKKCKNGFILDVECFGIWHEKQIAKDIELENGDLIRCVICYNDVYERYNKIGVKMCVEISKLYKTSSDLYSIHKLQKIEVGEMESRRNFNKIIKESENYSNEKVLEIAGEKTA